MTTARGTLIKGAAALVAVGTAVAQGQKAPRGGVARKEPHLLVLPLEQQVAGGCCGHLVPRALVHRRC